MTSDDTGNDVRANGEETVCIACGETLARTDVREYDEYGGGWVREGKRFENLRKPCHRDRCHSPRDGLEATLIEVGAGETARDSFLWAFLDSFECEPTAESGG